MATAKKQLAATKAAVAKKPAPAPAARPNALTMAPKTPPRPQVPFGQTIGNLLGGVGNAIRPAIQQVPGAINQQPGRSVGQSIGGLLGGIGNAIRPAIQQVPQVLPRGPVNPYSIDPVRPPGSGMPAEGFGGYGFDPTLVDYLNQQRERSMYDAGVSYQYDPATQTFRGATMGGPVTKTLAQMQAEAAGRSTGFPGRGMPGFGGDPRFPGPMSGLSPVLPSPEEANQRFAEQYAAFARDMAMGRAPIDQATFDAQQGRERQMYAQQLQEEEMARRAATPDYVSPYLGGPSGLGSAGPMQPPQQDSYRAYMDDFMKKSAANSMNPNAPQISPMNFEGFQRRFPNGYTPGSIFNPGSPPPQGPMPPKFMGGPADKMGPQNPQTGMPQFAGPYARGFMGLGQAAANQMGLGQAAAVAAQRPQLTNPYPRPQQRPMPGNYGGYNSIQGMGSNQYGGFNSPPPGMGQMGMGQMAQQQPQTQNNMFGNFGGFGQALGGGQNQGPNQQAQQQDQYGNFGGGGNQGGGNQGGGGGGLF